MGCVVKLESSFTLLKVIVNAILTWSFFLKKDILRILFLQNLISLVQAKNEKQNQLAFQDRMFRTPVSNTATRDIYTSAKSHVRDGCERSTQKSIYTMLGCT